MRKFGIISVSHVALLAWLTPVLASEQQKGLERWGQLMEKTTPVQRARFESRWMEKNLNLSHKQAVKVGKIDLRSAEQIQSIYDSQDNKLQKAREIMRVREAKDRQLERVLTEGQFGEYQAKKQEVAQKMHEMR